MTAFHETYVGQRPYNLETIQHAVKKFWVIGVISNPARYSVRYNLFFRWLERLKRAEGVNVFIVEVQQGEREFVCTERSNPLHLQMRTTDELWIKENMINLAINQLTTGAAVRATGVEPEYVAWIDCDIYFENETNWHYETLHQLQSYDIVQMWETGIDLGPNGEMISARPHTSFMSCYRKYGIENYRLGSTIVKTPYGNKTIPAKQSDIYYHPGFAWAARLSKLSRLGLLPDRCIIGAADHHMAMSLVGIAEKSVPTDFAKDSPYYLEMILDYQRKCQREVQGRVGFVKGSIYHWWHGAKKLRKYWERWGCLRPKKNASGNIVESAYDPYLDVYADGQGLLQLDGEKPILRNMLHDYFRMRNEDSVDTLD